jgi:hypothetical protein
MGATVEEMVSFFRKFAGRIFLSSNQMGTTPVQTPEIEPWWSSLASEFTTVLCAPLQQVSWFH